jgi:hypothetical protein
VEEEILLALRKLWNTDIPSKVQVFGWRLLLKRLPTRAALSRRGILINPHDLNCVFCSLPVEDTAHLFFSCTFSQGVWDDILNWLGKDFLVGSEGWHHFMLFGDLFRIKDAGRVRYLIWLAVTWNIWRLRNEVIFQGGAPDASSLIDNIKGSCWLWFSSRFGRKACIPFSSWCIDPMSCFQNV